jgi:hypothetical protein
MMRMLRHEPSRGIGGEPKRSGDSPPRNQSHSRGQTDKRYAFARRAAVPSGGNAVNITEDVRKYAAEQGLAEKSKEFIESGAEVYQPA